METLIWPTINVLTLTAVLVYFVRKPLVEYVRNRKVEVESAIKEASALKSEVESRLRDLESRLSRLDAETATVMNAARSEATRMSQEIIRKAKELAETVRKDAEFSAKGSVEQLKREVVAELGASLVERVEAQVRDRLTQQDRKKMQVDFSKNFEGGSA